MIWEPSDAVREVLEKPILVIGAGSIGQRHIKNLLELGAKQIIVYDERFRDLLELMDDATKRRMDADSMDRPLEWIEQIALAKDLESGLKIDWPKVALICTPTNNHVTTIEACAETGVRFLFIEKPLASDTSAYHLLPYGAEWNSRTFVACNFRFTQGLRRVKQLIDEGAIGKVVSARAQFGQYLPDMRPNTDHRKGYAANRSMGGGCLLDGIHEFDYLWWLLGPIAEAKVFTARLTDVTVDTEDVAEAILRFESGALGSVHEDYVLPRYMRELNLWGTKGFLYWEYFAWVEKLVVQGGDDKHLVVEDIQFYDHKDENNDMYLAELQHFLRVCAGEEKSCNTVADAYRLLQVVLKARE